MKPPLKVPFGLKDGRLFEPTQVPNGKACGCLCPACKKPLVAKQKFSTPHFAHSQDENCEKGRETAIHFAVKQIIAEEMKVRLPAVVWENPSPRYSQRIQVYPERMMQLESVILEQVIDDFIPDIVVVSGGETYLVEVAVTHFIDQEKQIKINNKGIPTFEIDVGELKDRFTFADLEHALFDSANYQAEWKYHPILVKFDSDEIVKQEQRLADLAREEQQEEDESESQRWKFARYQALTPEEIFQINLKCIGLTEQQMSKLSVAVPWDNSFGISEVVWQSTVLAYISKVPEEKRGRKYLPRTVNSNDCLRCLEDCFESRNDDDDKKFALLRYFRHLESIGILKQRSLTDYYILLGKQDWTSSNIATFNTPSFS